MWQRMLQGGSGGGSDYININLPTLPIVETQIVADPNNLNTNNPPKNVFDGNSSTAWYVKTNSTSASNIYVGYDFIDRIKFKSAYIKQLTSSNNESIIYRFEGSNNNNDWLPLTLDITQTTAEGENFFTQNVDKYRYYRLFIVSQTFSSKMYAGRISELSFTGEFMQ